MLPGVKYKVIVTLSISLCTKYCVGVPVDVLFDRAWYYDLFIFVRGVSILEFLKDASNISSTP